MSKSIRFFKLSKSLISKTDNHNVFKRLPLGKKKNQTTNQTKTTKPVAFSVENIQGGVSLLSF